MRFKNQEHFLRVANEKHNNKYDYSEVEFRNNATKIIITCPIHGKFEQRPDYHITGYGCRRCGVDARNLKNTSTSEEFFKSCNQKHNNKYDYSKSVYTKNTNKIIIICPIHGEFTQTANNHRHGQGCNRCGIDNRIKLTTLTTQSFITKSKLIHSESNYDYSKVNYTHGKSPVIIICPSHGEFHQIPNSHLMGKGCPVCSHRISRSENNVRSYIKSLDSSVTPQTKGLIPPYEVDMYLPTLRIAVEYNGNYWHSESRGKDKSYHLNKTKLCNDNNIQLIHIFEDEWLFKGDIVKRRLKSIMGKNKYRTYARKCEVREIDNLTKRQFLEKYHIQGDDKSSIRLGLFYRGRLVAVMTFGKRRFDKKDGYELVRYCTIGNFTIVGGAGKLLKHFERVWTPVAVISYADLRWSEGGLYKVLGFRHLRNSSPNYFYLKRSPTRLSRHQFMKHKLKDKLDVFDSSISERENMKANGYDRIWDCGNMVFEKVY